jgi:hypothetical protein
MFPSQVKRQGPRRAMRSLFVVLLALALMACGETGDAPNGSSPNNTATGNQNSAGETELPLLERLTGDTDRVPDVMNGLIAHIHATLPEADEVGEGWGYGITGRARKSDSKHTRQIYEHAANRQNIRASCERTDSVSRAQARLIEFMGRNTRTPVADLGDEAYRLTRRPTIYFCRANVVVKVQCSTKRSEPALMLVAKAIDKKIQNTLKP